MNEKILSAHPSEISEHLAEELRAVIGHIKEQIGPVCDTPLAIIRLVNGLCHDDWVNLASMHNLQNWIALSISKKEGEILQELLTAQQQLMYQRDHDPLTGLPNRRVFFDRLTIELTRAKRTNGDASVVMIDIDDFKKVNDTYGHLCGDHVLKDLAQHLSTNIRLYDTASRVGGEEFAVLLPSTSITTARSIIDGMREEFSRHLFTWDANQFRCTFSAGVSSVKALGHAPSPEAFFNSADQAMYEAKRAGKNQVCIHKADYLRRDNHSLVCSHEKQFLFSGIITDHDNE